MNKEITSLIFVLTIFTYSSAAGDFYIKSGVGKTELTLDDNDTDSTTRFELGLGYEINEWFSIESSYFENGKFDVPHPNQTENLPTNGRQFHYAPMEIDGINVTSRFDIEMTEDWAILTKHGFTSYSIKQTSFGDLKKSTTTYTPSIGISYTPRAIENLVIDLEYVYESFSTFDGRPRKAKADTIRLGINWKL